MNQIISALRDKFPQLSEFEDDQLLEGVYRVYPDALKDKDFRRDYQLKIGRDRIASETADEYRKSDQEQFGDSAIGNVLSYLAPGGRAIARGAGHFVEGLIGAQEAVAAAPRVHLGDNILTRAFEQMAGPSPAQRVADDYAGTLSGYPTEAPERLKDAFSDGVGPTAAWIAERGLEQVPQAVGSIGSAGIAQLVGLPVKAAAILGEFLPTFLQEAGSSYRDIRDTTGTEAPLTAAGVGTVNAALETLGGLPLMQRVLGGGDFVAQTVGEAVRRGSGRAVTQGLRESATEAGQELSTALLPAVTGVAPVPGDLGERVLESAVAGFGPGFVGSAAVDTLSGRTAIRPPEIPAEVTRNQELGDAMGRLRESAAAERVQRDADDLLANQIADARVEAERSRMTAEQFGQLDQAENAIKIQESLRQVDALLERASKRESTVPDIPIVESRQFGEPTLATTRLAEEAQRRAGMTDQQRSALELLERPLNTPEPVSRLRQAEVPDTLSGLDTSESGTIAPTPIDWLFQRARENRVRLNPTFGLDDAVLSSEDTSFTSSPVDQFIQDNQGLRTGVQIQEQQVPDTESGLTTAEETADKSPITQFINRVRQGQRARRASAIRSKKAALRRQEPRPERPTKRQSGQVYGLSQKQASLLERLTEIPQAEQDRARGTEDPQTDEGWALREILNARQTAEQYVASRGEQANDNTISYLERRYQERILSLLDSPRTAPLGPTLLRNRNRFLGQAMLSARQRMAGAGQITGQREVPTEVQGESGPVVSSEVEQAAQPSSEYFAKSSTAQAAKELIGDFVADNALDQDQSQAAMNLIARGLGIPDIFTNRNPDRKIAEGDPELQAKVNALIAAHKGAFRAHLGQEERVPIGVQRVRSVVSQLTNSDKVTVVYDPSLRQNDRPVSGYVTPDGKIVLNAAYIDSEQMAREVLLEEMMHAVFSETEVQSAWDEVLGSLTEQEIQTAVDQGYSPEVAQEEAAIRKVIREVESRRTSGPVAKFIRAVVDAIKRAFGITGNDAYATILKRALEAGGKPGQTGERYSLSDGRWRSADDLANDLAGAGDQETLRQSAAQQGLLIPENTVQQIVATDSAKKKSRSDRVFLALTKPLLKVRKLVGQSGWATPYGIGMSTGLTAIPTEAQDIAADAVIKESAAHRRMQESMDEKMEKSVGRVNAALERLPEAITKRNDSYLYEKILDGLVGAYNEYLRDEKATANASGNIDAARNQEIDQASIKIAEGRRNIGSGIASTLRLVAREIPDTALTDNNAAVQWIEGRLNDPSQPSIASDQVKDWLFNPPTARHVAPIYRDNRLVDRLKLMRKLDDEKSGALNRIEAFKAAMTGGKRKPSTREVFNRYADYRQKARDSIEEAKLIFREVDNAEGELDGLNRAKDLYGRMIQSPEYQTRLGQAAERLNATSRGIKVLVSNAKGEMTGEVEYLNPKTEGRVRINLQPNYGEEQKAQDAIRKLINDVQQWMAGSDDVLKRNAWEKELQWLMDYGLQISPGLMTGTQFLGMRVPSMWQVTPVFGRAGSAGRVDARNNIWKRVGNRMVVAAHQAGQITDYVARWFEQRQGSGRHSEQKIKTAVIEALKSHGKVTKGAISRNDHINAADVREWWEPLVAEPIIASNQNPTSVPLKVGDWVNGIQITKEDIAAVEQMKGYGSDAVQMLQNQGKDGLRGLVLNPLTQEEQYQGQSIVRRATDYGYKMARIISDRMYQVSQDWLQADENGKVGLLDEHFNTLLMGFIRETNKEWVSPINARDQEVWSDIRKLERANELPFTNFDGYLDYMAEKLYDPESGVSLEQERQYAKDRFLGYVTTAARNLEKAVGDNVRIADEEFSKKGIPKPVVQSLATGSNPFTTARGRLVAPSVFYQHSIATDTARAWYRSNALNALTMREIEAIQLAEAAMAKELTKYEGPNGLIAQERKKGTRFPTNAVARRSHQKARAGELMTDYRTLKDNLATTRILLADMKRLAGEHITVPEDTAGVAVSNEIRRSLAGSLLASIRSVVTNVFGSITMGSWFRRNTGTWRFLTAPVELMQQWSKDLAGNMLSKLRKIPGIDPTIKTLLHVPGIEQIVTEFVNNQMRWEQLRERTKSALVVDDANLKGNLENISASPGTYGRIADDEQGSAITALNWFMATPVLRQLNEATKATFPGAVDRAANTATFAMVEGWVNKFGEEVRRAWEGRDTGTDGWDDLTNPLNSFGPADAGVRNNTDLKFWRDLLSPVGSIERLSLEYYKRTKGLTNEQRKGVPFLTEAQIGNVALEALKDINLPTASTTPTIVQGKGLSGSVRRWLGLFQRYVVNAMGVLERSGGIVPGDKTSTWKVASYAAMMALMLVLGGLSKDLGQWGTEIVFGEPRTVPSFFQTLQSDQWQDYTKYLGVALAANAPFWGERVLQMVGGGYGKPGMDYSRMFLPFSVAADVENTVSRIAQTGDAYYPMADFLRRYAPLPGALLSQLDTGDTQNRGAMRAARLAATADMEVRQAGGTGVNRETPMTPLVRDAANALVTGDQEGYQRAFDQAVEYRIGQGQSRQEAERSVRASIAGRDPAARVFGRRVTEDEERRLVSRMSPVQRRSFLRARDAFRSVREPQRTRGRRGLRRRQRRRRSGLRRR